MRISDWSSDVCSSDLPGEDAAAVFADCRSLGGLTLFLSRHINRAVDGAQSVCFCDLGQKMIGGDLRRSEERRVGKEDSSTGRYGWTRYHQKKKTRPN